MEIKKLIRNKILVEVALAETQTSSGIFLPGSAIKEKFEGKVLMTGPKVTSVKEGDTIRYYEHCGSSVTNNGKDCLILNELTDVIAVL